MDETLFKTLSDKILLKLSEAIENTDKNGDMDIEYASGVLTITLANKKQYVINQHVPMRQIWVSSPVSGEGHYEYSDGRWKNTRSGQDLLELVKKEFNITL